MSSEEVRHSAVAGRRLEDVAKTLGEQRRDSARAEARARRAPELATVAQAVVAMELLTGNSEFDAFLAQIQTWHNHATEALDAEIQSFQTDISMDHATLAQHKLAVQKLTVTRDAFRKVLELPSENAKAGRAANREMAQGESDNA